MNVTKLVLCLSLCSLISLAQNGSGSLAGMVLDPFGHPFNRATVQAKNTVTGTIYKAPTDASGAYKMTGLPPGQYDVVVSVPTIKTFERKGVPVADAKTTDLEIKFEESGQLGTLGEDALAALEDQKRHAPPTGPTPRTGDGKVDFSGVWWRMVDVDPGKPEWLPGAVEIAKKRIASNNFESPQAHCLPSQVLRWGPLFQFAQSKDAIVVVNDDESPGFHQFRLNRDHPKELDMDLWYGDSVGRWEGDTLVVDRVGFNDQVWLDQGSHPHSDKLHVIERYKRPDLGHLEQEVIVEDPGVLAKPWVIKRKADLANEEIREFICAENNRDVTHLTGK